jgi:hypothetical protein
LAREAVSEMSFSAKYAAIDQHRGVQKMSSKKKNLRKNQSGVYSRGQQNFIVDSIVHPIAQKNPLFIILDEALHMAVEQNIAVSAQKFCKYSVPYILNRYAKKRG